MSAPKAPSVGAYENLIRGLIAADQVCPADSCGVSMLGHLMGALTAEQVEMVRALGPDAGQVSQ